MKPSVKSVAGILLVLLISTAVHAELQLVTDFEGMTGTPDGQACNGVLGGFIDSETEGTGNHTFGVTGGSNGLNYRGQSTGGLRAVGVGGITNPIDEGETGIGFCRFMVRSASLTVRTHIGLIANATDDPINSTTAADPMTVPAGFRLVQNGTGFDVVTLDGATVLKPGLARNQWYNLWIVANNAADTFDLYLSTAEGPAGPPTLPAPEDLIEAGLAFAAATTEPLNCMMFSNPTGTVQAEVVYIDEIWWDGDQGLSKPNKATSPSPASDLSDVPQDVVLSWTPVPSAVTRNVYLGTLLADVEAASIDDPRGVLAKAGLDVTTYDPPGLLEFGQTYYWRVDEVNAAPDGTVFPGSVWSFTVEPYAYQLTPVSASASSSNNADMGPEKTIDGSGLDTAGLHGTIDTTMWLSDPAGPKPAWIEYQFDRVYKLQEMWVWNSNQSLEPFAGVGARNVTVEYAADANDWQVLSGVPEFNRAPGTTGYAHDTVVDFAGVAASKVRLTINSNWGGFMPQTGLSEVRFFQVPVRAREPQPDVGAANVNPNNLTLHWRSGREAVSHQVFLSTDSNAVADSSALIDTSSANSYSLNALDLGATYSWRIDEVNQAASPSLWQGDVWSFSTAEYLVIDDFESYTNDSPNRLFQTWIDGIGFSADDFFPVDNPGNNTGSAVGHDIWMAGPTHRTIAETSIIHGGRQSMPLSYDNSSFAYSETERTWKTPQNWTTNGADTLNLYFQGAPTGFLELSPTHILMNGTGSDIYGTADQGRFVYKQLTGDGTIIARVDRLDNTHAWAKAGVMIRNSLDAGASWALALASPGNGTHFQARLSTGAGATSDTTLTLPVEQTTAQIPLWVKLERAGDRFSVYYATGETPTTWVANPWNPQTIPMNADVYVGLAVTSHATGVVTQAELSGIEIIGTVTGSWQSVSLGVEQPAGNLPDTLYVRLEDSNGGKATAINADPYAVGAGIWTAWSIPLSTFTSAGVKTDSTTKMVIGVGDKDKPASKATGLLYIDDIGFGRPASQ
jgi:hypothetical protein